MKSIAIPILFVAVFSLVFSGFAQAQSQLLFPIQYSQIPNTASTYDQQQPPVDPRYMTFEQFMQFMYLYKDFFGFGDNIDIKKVYKEYHNDDDDDDDDHDHDHKHKKKSWWKDKDDDRDKKHKDWWEKEKAAREDHRCEEPGTPNCGGDDDDKDDDKDKDDSNDEDSDNGRDNDDDDDEDDSGNDDSDDSGGDDNDDNDSDSGDDDDGGGDSDDGGGDDGE